MRRARFTLTFKRGVKVVAEVQGADVDLSAFTLGETAGIIQTEQFIERITGLRLHINIQEWTNDNQEDERREGNRES
jgi:hypothetical protein